MTYKILLLYSLYLFSFILYWNHNLEIVQTTNICSISANNQFPSQNLAKYSEKLSFLFGVLYIVFSKNRTWHGSQIIQMNILGPYLCVHVFLDDWHYQLFRCWSPWAFYTSYLSKTHRFVFKQRRPKIKHECLLRLICYLSFLNNFLSSSLTLQVQLSLENIKFNVWCILWNFLYYHIHCIL